MRILLVAHGLPPESVGGVEQHVDGLAAALSAEGHQVEVWARTGRGGPQASSVTETHRWGEATRVVYRYEGLGALADLYDVPALDAAFRSFLAARSFDVCHVHHLTGMSVGLVEELRRNGIPCVLTLHDYWLMCPRGQMWRSDGERCARVEPVRCAECLRPTFGGWLPADRAPELVAAVHDRARAVLDAADVLVVPSARVRKPFAELGVPAERIRVVENGVDTEALRALPAPSPRPGGPLRVGYLGTLIPSKGLDVLVDACRSLPPGKTALEVFGNVVPYHGDEGFATRVFARLRPRDLVTYHGPYLPAELPRILARLDVVVAPALWHEAFGLTLREALAAGRPVVASRVGGLQDAVSEGVEGFVVEPGDVAGLAARLRELAEDPGRVARMGAAGRARARGFREMARDLLAVYAAAALDPP